MFPKQGTKNSLSTVGGTPPTLVVNNSPALQGHANINQVPQVTLQVSPKAPHNLYNTPPIQNQFAPPTYLPIPFPQPPIAPSNISAAPSAPASDLSAAITLMTKLTCKDKVFEWTHKCRKAFNALKESLCEQPILKYADTKKGYTLCTDASKYGWAGVLTQVHTMEIEGNTVTKDHPVAYVSGLFRGSQLNWAALTKEAYAIYMSVKKLSFYLTDAAVLLKSDHLPLKKFLQKNTLNNKVNNWAMELEVFNIKFQHVSGKTNILEDTLRHLVDIDLDARLDPENAGWEFGYYVFETLPKLSSQNTVQVCEILSGNNVIRPDPDLQEPFIQLRYPLTLDQLQALQAQDEKCTTLADMLR